MLKDTEWKLLTDAVSNHLLNTVDPHGALLHPARGFHRAVLNWAPGRARTRVAWCGDSVRKGCAGTRRRC